MGGQRFSSTFLSAKPLEGISLRKARVRDDLGAQLDGQVDGLVALWQLTVIQEGQQLSQGHLRGEGLT